MRSYAARLASCLILVSASFAQAQPVVERVEGAVTDPFGGKVQADATLRSISGYLEATETDENGRFVFESVVPGTYTLTVSSKGFSTSTQEITARDANIQIPVTLVPDRPATVVVTTTDPQGLALPGTIVNLEGPAGTSLEGVTDDRGIYSTGSVRPGRWLVEARLPGFQADRTEVTAFYGPAAQAVLALGLDYEVSEDLVVLGATRPVGRRTDVRAMDSPVTTAVVRSDSIVAQASANVGDPLRGVPGLNIVQLSARDTQITSRQATSILANSQLVLLDGRSVYLDFFGMVLWDSLPMGTDDIEQIEVVRGPASVTWGPNAMTGAVHFITKAPRDTLGTTVTMGGGWLDRNAGSTAGSGPGTMMTSNVSVSRAPSDSIAYRISAGYFRSPALPPPRGADTPDGGPARDEGHRRRRRLPRRRRRAARSGVREPRNGAAQVRRPRRPGPRQRRTAPVLRGRERNREGDPHGPSLNTVALRLFWLYAVPPETEIWRGGCPEHKRFCRVVRGCRTI